MRDRDQVVTCISEYEAQIDDEALVELWVSHHSHEETLSDLNVDELLAYEQRLRGALGI